MVKVAQRKLKERKSSDQGGGGEETALSSGAVVAVSAATGIAGTLASIILVNIAIRKSKAKAGVGLTKIVGKQKKFIEFTYLDHMYTLVSAEVLKEKTVMTDKKDVLDKAYSFISSGYCCFAEMARVIHTGKKYNTGYTDKCVTAFEELLSTDVRYSEDTDQNDGVE